MDGDTGGRSWSRRLPGLLTSLSELRLRRGLDGGRCDERVCGRAGG